MHKIILAAALLAAIATAGCTDAERASFSALGKEATVTCYSGGQVVFEATSTGKVVSLDSAGVAFKDQATGKYVRAYADCIVRED